MKCAKDIMASLTVLYDCKSIHFVINQGGLNSGNRMLMFL